MSQIELQQRLEQAIKNEDATGINESIRNGADQNLPLPSGVLPMVLAVYNGSTAAVAALRGYEISDEQWRAASDAAAGTDLEGMIQAKDEPVPKPKGT